MLRAGQCIRKEGRRRGSFQTGRTGLTDQTDRIVRMRTDADNSAWPSCLCYATKLRQGYAAYAPLTLSSLAW